MDAFFAENRRLLAKAFSPCELPVRVGAQTMRLLSALATLPELSLCAGISLHCASRRALLRKLVHGSLELVLLPASPPVKLPASCGCVLLSQEAAEAVLVVWNRSRPCIARDRILSRLKAEAHAAGVVFSVHL